MKLGLFFIMVGLIQGFSAEIDGISSNQKKHAEMIEAEEFFMKSISRIDWLYWFNWGFDRGCDYFYPNDWKDCIACSEGNYAHI